MGLDINLCKREKSSSNKDKWESICYWRKANQIRDWFSRTLDDFEDNGDTPVTKSDLELLLEDCKKVLKNHDLCDEVLPSSSGFFFGSTDYDEYYFNDIQFTVDKLTEILDTTDFDKYDVIYHEWY